MAPCKAADKNVVLQGVLLFNAVLFYCRKAADCLELTYRTD